MNCKSWKLWAAIIAVTLAIVVVVLYFTCPKFAFAASGLLIGGLTGFILGYIVANKKSKSIC